MSGRFHAAISTAAAVFAAPVSAHILVDGGFESAVKVLLYNDIDAPDGHVSAVSTITQHLPD